VSDQWLKPDFQEIGVSGECTAYAGTQGAREANNHDIITAAPMNCRELNDRASGEGPLTTASSPWTH